jgi:hypothetical protein
MIAGGYHVGKFLTFQFCATGSAALIIPIYFCILTRMQEVLTFLRAKIQKSSLDSGVQRSSQHT